jgi:hypothetical protein
MSKTLRFRFEHDRGREEILRRIHDRCARAGERRTVVFDAAEWHQCGGDFTITALGLTFTAQLAVDDRRVELMLELPLLARPLADRIGCVLEGEAHAILETDALSAGPGSEAVAGIHAASRRMPDMSGTETGRASCAVVGVISGYGWQDISVWTTSLLQTGFSGDRVLIALDIDPALADGLRELGLKVISPAPQERLGGAPILVERFQLVARFLAGAAYEYVVLTDVKDLVFQRDPAPLLLDLLGGHGLLVPSEGLRLRDEWWGSYMLKTDFGAQALRSIRNSESRNAGVIAGTSDQCRRLCQAIVELCTRDGMKGADQAAYNLLLNRAPWTSEARTVRHDVPWACQAGTVADPRQLPLFRDKLIDVQPQFDGSMVTTPAGEPYAIVHQYDRVPAWRSYFEGRFGYSPFAQPAPEQQAAWT